MRISRSLSLGSNETPRAERSGSARTGLLLAIAFALCLTAAGYWFYAASNRSPAPAQVETATPPGIQLSDATRAALGRLDAPLEIRFYSLLDPASVPAPVSAFSARVDQLLAAYQQEAGDKIKVTRFSSPADINPNAPPADGIQAFNIDKGEACYLGMALAYKGHKESLPRLSPDYEQAVEPDITRAIARLEDAAQPVQAPTAISQLNTTAVQEVKAKIPDLASVSVEQGTRMIQSTNLKDLNLLKKETDARVKEAEQRFATAKASGSEAEQQAARQGLEHAQLEQKAKIAEFYARSEAQIQAFQQLKAAAR